MCQKERLAKMNTIPQNQCNNKPNFTAFQKPNKQVLSYFSEAIGELNPENRKIFVNAVGKIVEGAKGCPEPISHEICSGYTPYYTPVVRGQRITTDKQHNCRANFILDVMQKASDKAKDLADADANYNDICKIFNVVA